MKRQQKAAVIDSLKDSFSNSKAAFLVGYQGMTVTQMQALRGKLREQGGRLQVAKARLMKRAGEGVEGVDQMVPYFKEQVGLVFASEEPPAIAKVLHEFSKDNEALTLVVGMLDSALLDSGSIARIASLPSKEVLLAQMCGTMKAPIGNFANVLNVLILRLLWTLKQVGDKKQ